MTPKHYSNKNHINNLINRPYYKNLVRLRNIIEIASDTYFQTLNAPKVDLFLITKGVSSPTGKGSDSLPLPFKLGNQNVYLTDSAQFGMEPLVQKSFKAVYCYLPSFRGEDANDSHLNQFYHCEAEIRGDYKKCIVVAEELVSHIIKELLNSYNSRLIKLPRNSIKKLEYIICQKFPRITFDKSFKLLQDHNLEHLVEIKPYGRVLTRQGELKIAELLGNNQIPVWITEYDRDVVPFYQKPNPLNTERVLNADLIFPSFGGFGGEIIGLGQRQDNFEQIIESMKRQGIHGTSAYEWYINLRKRSDHKTTSGFGLGIERLIAGILRLKSIADAAIYPVIKNETINY